MAFKIRKGASAVPETPEALLNDLRQRKIPGILAHQSDIIRSYMEQHEKVSDIALQLPTGSGKTLVGLLIAEWRRRKYRERVVYLCPTNQLVNQVVEQSTTQYGLRVAGFTGEKKKYDLTLSSEYQNAEVVAVTNYSSLFNVNPFFSDAEIIILDDAHSAENYISKFWSLSIHRLKKEESPAFNAVHSVIQSLLSSTDAAKMTVPVGSDDWDDRWVEKLPTPRLHEVHGELRAALDEYTDGTDLYFPWSMIRDHLDACHMYVSAREILIRPLIPPSDTHAPFSNAKQRIYMSATLGAGGDLERVTGMKNIVCLPPPVGWDKQGIGRRFFMLPHKSLDEAQTNDFIVSAVKIAKRALYLVPDDRAETRIAEKMAKIAGMKIFDANQLEASKTPFVRADKAIAVIANRYDGIDLVGDECRLLIVEGLPKGANLQERFFTSRVGASILLQDRILTRVIQAFGRCTRSPNDYASVVVVGEQLHKYLLSRENRGFFHPEIQAEIEFGIDQSGLPKDELLENFRHFIKQNAEWERADDAIVDRREGLVQKQLPSAAQMKGAVGDEIAYQRAMWTGDYVAALECCRKILTKFTEPGLRGYRALWMYLAGSCAWLATKEQGKGLEAVSNNFFVQAKNAAPGLRWLTNLHVSAADTAKVVEVNSATFLIEGIENVLDTLGTVQDRKYDSMEKEIREAIMQDDDVPRFERGHKELGSLLGYQAGKIEASGTPDPWWIAGKYCFVFEDFSQAESTSIVGVNKARQASGHPKWIKEHLSLNDDVQIVSILMTDCAHCEKNAVPHLRDVHVWELTAFRKWAENALKVMRELRRAYPGEGNLNWQAEAIERLDVEGISPNKIIKGLKGVAADVLEVKPPAA